MDAAPFDRAGIPSQAELYGRVRHHVPAIEWPALAADIEAIQALKRERNAVVLAHNYQAPEIFHTVADIVGDSLLLAREATKVDADIIVLAGVHSGGRTRSHLNSAAAAVAQAYLTQLVVRSIVFEHYHSL